MNFRIKLILISCIYLSIMNLTACQEKPNSPKFDNLYDPNGEFDDIPPLALFTVSQDSGIADETIFEFDASASVEEDYPKLKLLMRWDFDGDSIWDTEWTNDKIITHIYKQGGGWKNVNLQVQGAKYLFSDTSMSIFVNSRPNAKFIYVEDSLIEKNYIFDSTPCIDEEDSTDLLYRWDFNDDGFWDTEWINQKKIERLINEANYVVLQVIDQDGLTDNFVWSLSLPNNAGLLAYYPLNSNAFDFSGNDKHGTVIGSNFVSNRYNESNSAYNIANYEQYIILGDVKDIKLYDTKFSISMWLYPSSIASTIFRYGQIMRIGINRDHMLYCTLFSTHSGASTSTSSIENIKLDEWQHVVINFENKWWLWDPAFDIYVNGSKIDAEGGSGLGIGSFAAPTSGDFFIAGFIGTIDEVFIFNRTLNEDEIQLLYKYKE